jgi:hypothetical protein
MSNALGNKEEDKKKIHIATTGGANTGEDADQKKEQDWYQWVRKNTTPE